MTITEAFELYRSDVIAFTNQSRKTEEAHQIARNSLIKFAGDMPLSDLSFDVIRRWKMSMETRHLSDETIRGYLLKLRVVLKYMNSLGHECLNYEKVKLPKRGSKRPNFIDASDVQKLIDAQDKPGTKHILRARNKAVISLLFSSGIRVSELCKMDIKDVKRDFFTVIGKGGVAAPSFIDERTRGLIDAYLNMRRDNNPALFVSDLNKKRTNPGNVQEILKFAVGWTGLYGA